KKTYPVFRRLLFKLLPKLQKKKEKKENGYLPFKTLLSCLSYNMPITESCVEILNAYQNRGNGGEFDNNEKVKRIANLRLEKANLLGYKTFADYSLEETMAKSPKGVYDLLNKLWVPALAKAKEEEAEIKKMMEADGIKDDVQP